MAPMSEFRIPCHISTVIKAGIAQGTMNRCGRCFFPFRCGLLSGIARSIPTVTTPRTLKNDQTSVQKKTRAKVRNSAPETMRK